MALFFRILSGLFAMLGIGLIALMAIVWVDGKSLAASGGKVWFDLHASSLGYLQTIIQRHLNLPAVWDDYAVPLLQQPAWQVMLIAAVFLLVLAMLFGLLGRKRARSGNKFHSADIGS